MNRQTVFTAEQQKDQETYLFKKISKLRMSYPPGPVVVACLKMILVEYLAVKDDSAYRASVREALQIVLKELEANA